MYGNLTVPLEVDVNQVAVDLEVSGGVTPKLNGDYDTLINKPQINGVELIENKTSAELGIDQTYIHNQSTASAEWTISHNLNKYPSVTVVDSAGSVVVGDVDYLDSNNVQVSFSGEFSGKAYLN